MGRMLSAHFSEEEMDCGCGCGRCSVHPRLLELLESLRAWAGRPIPVHSGCRCESHNALKGGKPDSQHLLGRAADFAIEGMQGWRSLKFLRSIMLNLGFTGVGIYRGAQGNGWVHGDVRALRPGEKTHLWEG